MKNIFAVLSIKSKLKENEKKAIENEMLSTREAINISTISLKIILFILSTPLHKQFLQEQG